jgi:hypothetical protein
MEKISWRRLLLIVGFMAVVLGLAYLLYATFFRTSSGPTPGGPTTGPGGQLPTIPPGGPTPTDVSPTGLPLEGPGSINQPSDTATGGLTKTTRVAERSVGISENGNFVDYYQPTDGKFYRLGEDGTPTAISDEAFYSVQAVTWSPNHNNAVLEYPDGNNIVYDFRTKNKVTLPQHWQDFSFSPNGDQIVFESIGTDVDSRWLAVSDVSGNNQEAIRPLGDKARYVEVDWSPNQQIIAAYREPSGADQQELYFIGRNQENFRSTVVPGIGLSTAWTPDGQRLLFSTSAAANAYKPSLWLVEANGDNIGQNRQQLNLETWASKCTFRSNTSLICAVPQGLPDGAGLVPINSLDIPDDIYEINLTTGQRSLLARPAVNLSATKLQVTSDDALLYVQDKSGQLYKIAL